jgi:hypothetical protein
MTTTLKNLVEAKYAENSQTTQYTVGSTVRSTIIDSATATNVSGGNVVFSANVVPSGGSAGSSNLILQTKTITPGQTYMCRELIGKIMETGDFLSTLCDTASALVIDIDGREVT